MNHNRINPGKYVKNMLLISDLLLPRIIYLTRKYFRIKNINENCNIIKHKQRVRAGFFNKTLN